jgi:hypothetical protein
MKIVGVFVRFFVRRFIGKAGADPLDINDRVDVAEPVADGAANGPVHEHGFQIDLIPRVPPCQ